MEADTQLGVLHDSELTYRPVPLSRLFSLTSMIDEKVARRQLLRRRAILREILTLRIRWERRWRETDKWSNWSEEARAWSPTSRRLYGVAWNAESELEWMKGQAIMPAVFTGWQKARRREREGRLYRVHWAKLSTSCGIIHEKEKLKRIQLKNI